MPWPKGRKRPGYKPRAGIQRKCEPGCTCGRHRFDDERRSQISSSMMGRTLTPEHRAAVARGASTHGQSGKGRNDQTPTYKSWDSMKQRCLNSNAPNFHNYGGRGITITQRWLGKGGFENFLADLGPRPDGRTLDRINNNGNYEPGNCRWATHSEQMKNRRPRQKVSV